MKETFNTDYASKDAVIIPNYVAGFQCGIDVPKEFMGKVVYAGHPVVKKEGKYSLLALASDGKSFGDKEEGAEFVGVVKASRQTDAHFDQTLAVMDIGVVETKALHIPYTEELINEMSNLKIVLR